MLVAILLVTSLSLTAAALLRRPSAQAHELHVPLELRACPGDRIRLRLRWRLALGRPAAVELGVDDPRWNGPGGHLGRRPPGPGGGSCASWVQISGRSSQRGVLHLVLTANVPREVETGRYACAVTAREDGEQGRSAGLLGLLLEVGDPVQEPS